MIRARARNGTTMENEARNRAKEKVMNFSRNVAYIAKQRGGILHLEKEIGVSPGYISRTKNGKRNLSLETAIVIADALSHGIDELCEKDLFIDARIAELEREIEALKARKEQR